MFVSSLWRHIRLQGTVKVTGKFENLLSCVLIISVPLYCEGCIIYPLPIFMTPHVLLSTAWTYISLYNRWITKGTSTQIFCKIERPVGTLKTFWFIIAQCYHWDHSTYSSVAGEMTLGGAWTRHSMTWHHLVNGTSFPILHNHSDYTQYKVQDDVSMCLPLLRYYY